MNTYLHHTPGRLRIKIPSIKRNPAEAVFAAELVESHEGVMRCNANNVTGSLLIQYDQTATDANTVLQLLKDRGYVEGSTAADQSVRQLESIVLRVGEAIVKAMAMAVIEKLARRSAMAVIGALR